MDISKLSEEQKELAFKVGERAAKRGLNPDFILPMVMQESSFDHSKVSPQGAKGIMQITDDTAKLYKCDDPKDVDKNIDCGLDIIQDLVSKKNIGNDPYKVLAGYHSGEPQAKKFLETGNIDDLGPKAKQHLWDVSQRYGNELPKVMVGEESKDQDTGGVKPPALPPAGTPKPIADQGSTVPEINPLIGGIGGGILGAGAGQTAAYYQAHIDAAREALEAARNRGFLGGTPASASAATPAQITAPANATMQVATEGSLIPSEAQHTRSFQGTTKDQGVTGRASQTTYQLRTQQIAEEAKKQRDIMEALRRQRILAGNMPSPSGIMASTPAGIIAPTEAVQSYAAQEAAQAAPIAQAAPAAGKSSPLLTYLKKYAGMPIKGGLFGATAGLGAIDTLNRANQKDTEGATISGLGTLASLAAPYVASMGALPAASIAAPLYLSASDRIKYLKKHPEQIRLQEDQFDPMGNPLR
jgi:hypothetical protein